MPGSRRQQLRRGLTFAVLPAFLGFLLQPQVHTLYHVHQGGEYAHIHAWLPTSPNASYNDHHHDHHHHAHHHYSHSSHHYHAHAAGLQHSHSHDSAASLVDKRPQIRREHAPHNGHWHTTVAFHWVSLAYRESQAFVSLVHPLRQAAELIVDVPLILAFHSRAPPFLS